MKRYKRLIILILILFQVRLGLGIVFEDINFSFNSANCGTNNEISIKFLCEVAIENLKNIPSYIVNLTYALLGFSNNSSHNKDNREKSYKVTLCFLKDNNEDKRFSAEQFIYHNNIINQTIINSFKIFKYLFIFHIRFLDKETYYFLKPRSSI
jgi:hypothetical protein